MSSRILPNISNNILEITPVLVSTSAGMVSHYSFVIVYLSISSLDLFSLFLMLGDFILLVIWFLIGWHNI